VEVVEIAGAGSYDDVVLAHAPALLRLGVMLTGNAPDAEDLLQSTMLRAVRHGDRIAGMAAPAAYLRRIMLNEHLSLGRRAARRVRAVPVAEVPEHPTADAGPDDRDQVWRWLATLRPQQRAVLVLRFYEDLPDAEIAPLLGCSEATVRSHAFRGLAALRARLTEEDR
jgi:RNA polymerase sigma-70 factor (sigma-E family)